MSPVILHFYKKIQPSFLAATKDRVCQAADPRDIFKSYNNELLVFVLLLRGKKEY